MKIFLLSQTENRGYDTFDSCVVRAVDENAQITWTIMKNKVGIH